MNQPHRLAHLMTYRDLLAAINRDFQVRDDTRLDGPVVMAILDGRGEVHFGHLAAFSIGAIPDVETSVATADPAQLPEDPVYTSARRPPPPVALAPQDLSEDGLTRVVDVDDPPRDPGGLRADADQTCMIDLRPVPGDRMTWVDDPGDPGEAHTVYARSSFDEETTTTWGSRSARTSARTPARGTPRETLRSATIGQARPPCRQGQS